MPVKLAQLQKDFADLVKRFDQQAALLAPLAQNFQIHRDTAIEGRFALLTRIRALIKGGQKGDAVKDFVGDPEVKAFVIEIENQKKQLLKNSEAFWAARDSVAEILSKEAPALAAKAGEIVKDKKRQWFGSNSVDAISDLKTEIEDWTKNWADALKKGAKAKKPSTLNSLKPGTTLTATIKDLEPNALDVDFDDLAQHIKFLKTCVEKDKSRSATMKRVLDRVAQVAKQNPTA